MNEKKLGVDSQLTDLVRNGNNSSGFSTESMRLAAVGLTLVREMFPWNITESDEAAKLRLELMAEIAEEVGERRFVQAVRDAIKVSHKRWDVSVARVREMAGLRWTPQPSPAAQAWQFVTQVFIEHCRPDGDGNYRLEEKIVNFSGTARVFSVPEIPSAIKRAIRSLGGWAALAESHPEYWTQKFNQFKELYSEDASPRIDSRPGSELEKVK